jgi:hypothetical protein
MNSFIGRNQIPAIAKAPALMLAKKCEVRAPSRIRPAVSRDVLGEFCAGQPPAMYRA